MVAAELARVAVMVLLVIGMTGALSAASTVNGKVAVLLLLSCPVEPLAAVNITGVLHGIVPVKLLLLVSAMLLLAVGATESSLAVTITSMIQLPVMCVAVASAVLFLVVSVTVAFAVLLLVSSAAEILSVIAASVPSVVTVLSAVPLLVVVALAVIVAAQAIVASADAYTSVVRTAYALLLAMYSSAP